MGGGPRPALWPPRTRRLARYCSLRRANIEKPQRQQKRQRETCRPNDCSRRCIKYARKPFHSLRKTWSFNTSWRWQVQLPISTCYVDSLKGFVLNDPDSDQRLAVTQLMWGLTRINVSNRRNVFVAVVVCSARIDAVYPAWSGGRFAVGVYAHERLFDYGVCGRKGANGINRGGITSEQKRLASAPTEVA